MAGRTQRLDANWERYQRPRILAWRRRLHGPSAEARIIHDRLLLNPHTALYCDEGCDEFRTNGCAEVRRALSGKRAWKKKENEPATDLVWARTLQAIVNEESKLKVLPEINEAERTLVGLQIGESITPAMDVYFDKTNLQLVRIDWRKDINRFSDWKEHDGAKYPSQCIGYRKATGKPWYVSEITELRRLETLPSNLR